MEGVRQLRAADVAVWADEHVPATHAPLGSIAGGARLASPAVARGRAVLARLAAGGVADPASAYLALTVADARRAAEDLRHAYVASEGAEGLVEIASPPDVARDAAAIVELAERVWRDCGVPNVVVAVPGTDAGIAALQELTYRGIGTAVDCVLFAGRLAQVAEAFVRGLERRVIAGLELGRVASVAWIPLGPLSACLDRRLPAGSPLRGAVGPAIAQSIYLEATRHFSGPRWRRLARHGAHPQRPGFRDLADRPPDVIARLALPGSAIAVPAAGLDVPAGPAAEVDETEVAWMLREAIAAGLHPRDLAATLRQTEQEQRAFAHRALLAELAEELHRLGADRRGRRRRACG